MVGSAGLVTGEINHLWSEVWKGTDLELEFGSNLELDIDMLWPLLESALTRNKISRAKVILQVVMDKLITKPITKIPIHHYQGRLLVMEGRFKEAIIQFEASREQGLELGESFFYYISSVHLARIYSRQGEILKGLELLEQDFISDGLKGNLLDDPLLAMGLTELGNCYFRLSRYDQAEEYYIKSKTLWEKLGAARAVAGINNNLGVLNKYKGKISQSLHYYEQALKIFESLNDQHTYSMSLNNIANLYQIQGRLGRALDYHLKAYEIRKQLNIKALTAMSLNNLGSLYHDLGEFEKAYYYQKMSLWIRKGLGIEEEVILSLVDLAEVLYSLRLKNELDQLIGDFPLPPYENPNRIAYYHLIQGFRYLLQDKWMIAQKHFRQALLGEGISFHYYVVAYENLLECDIQLVGTDKPKELQDRLLVLFNQWEDKCKVNSLYASLLKIYILRAKLRVLFLNFDLARSELNQVVINAEEWGLPLHKKRALAEISELDEKQQKILSLSKSDDEIHQLDYNDMESFKQYIKDLNILIASAVDE